MKKVIWIVLALAAFGSIFYLAATVGAQDDDDPDVIATDPRSGESGVATNATIRVTFSEEMDPSSITTNTFTVANDFGSSIPGEVTYASRTAAFIPFTNMDELSSYTATVSAQVRDSSGNSLGWDYSWSFTTASD